MPDQEIKLNSDIFDDVGSLINAKDECVRDNSEALERKQVVRQFVNMLDTLSDQEREELGREESINYGSTFRAAQINIAPIESMVIGTDTLVNVAIDTDNAELDAELSAEISKIVNDGIFNRTERFDQFWRTIAGEGYISGGGPVIFDFKDAGLFPTYSPTLVFPKDTPLHAEGVTYCFDHLDMSIHDLEQLKDSVNDTETSFIDVEAIDSIIRTIREKIEGAGPDVDNLDSSGTQLSIDSNRKTTHNTTTTFDVWKYWEVRHNESDGTKYVSSITFVDNTAGVSTESGSVQTVIAQEEFAFDDPVEWLTMMVFDEEVGGKKTTDTLRGLAEAHYPASVMIEELRNLQIEGAMMTARPLPKYNDTVDPDEALDFRLGVDNFAPRGMDDFYQFPNTGHQLNPIVSEMMGTVAGITSSDRANTGRGQELRQQALERQNNSGILQTNRVTKAYKKLDHILTLIVGRLLSLNPPKGTDDYENFKWFQDKVDEKIVKIFNLVEDEETDGDDEFAMSDITGYSNTVQKQAKKIREKLAMKKHGRYCHLNVKATRSATGFDRDSEELNADFLLKMVETGKVPSQIVPQVLRTAVILQTQNPDIANMVSADPQPIRSTQREKAAMEWDIITRRATTGEVYPISPNDVHEDHFESHLVDLIAFVNANGIRPWDQLSVAQFSAGVEHTGFHIAELESNEGTRGRAAEFYPQLQEVIATATSIIKLLAQEEEAAAQGGSLDDQLTVAKIAKIYSDIEMMGRKYGVDINEKDQINQQRISRTRQSQERQNLMERQQLHREVMDNRKMQLDALNSLNKPSTQ